MALSKAGPPHGQDLCGSGHGALCQAVVDYLVARSGRIGIHGSSTGGYTAPRACTVEKRFKAYAV